MGDAGHPRITKENAINYVDSSFDGGFWFTFEGEEPVLYKATPKAIKMLGFSDEAELKQRGKLYLGEFFRMNSNKPEKQKEYQRFCRRETVAGRFDMQLVNARGESFYCDVRFAPSVLFEEECREEIILAEYYVSSTYDAIFRESKELLDEMGNGFVILQRRDRQQYEIVYCNREFSEELQLTLGQTMELYGENLLRLVCPEDCARVLQVLEEAASEEMVIKETYRLVTMDGEYVWMMGNHKTVRIGSDSFIYISYMNIQEMMGLQMRLEADNVKLLDMVNTLPVGMAIFSGVDGVLRTIALNETLVAFANEERQQDGREEKRWTNERLTAYLDRNPFAIAAEEDIPLLRQMMEESVQSGFARCTFRRRNFGAGKNRWIDCRCISKDMEEGRRNYYVTFQDVTAVKEYENELKENQNTLREMTYHDALTGTRNRAAYNELIDSARGKLLERVGIIFIDLNGLKAINDAVGHRGGDKTILRVIEILTKQFDAEQIYRISGDEFVIIVDNIAEDEFKNRIEQALAEIKQEDDLASVGYIWEEVVSDLKKKVHRSELLMYIEKQKYYASRRERQSKHRPKILNILLDDIAAGSYQVYLQPKAGIGNMEVVGAEALVRKVDIDGNVMAPDNFIPQLEKERLVSKIDFFILEEVCKLLERWKREDKKSIKVSVNMSRISLSESDYMEHVTAICNRYDIDRRQLEFEITESMETIDNRRMKHVVADMKAAGFGVSLDDMGTEYSSLRMLPIRGIDTVKLDRSFILQMEDSQGKILLQHVIEMCHDLGMICIAEGVEDTQQRIQLQEMGCDMYQGYLLAQPIPVAEFEKFLTVS